MTKIKHEWKPAIYLLDEFAQAAAALARYYGPNSVHRDDKKFFKYSKIAVEAAKAVAPYQTPKFRSLVTAVAGVKVK